MKTEDLLVYGGIGLAAFIGSYYFFSKKPFLKAIDYDMGPSIRDPDPFILAKLEEEMPTRTVVDDYTQSYNRWINGYREKPTMVPENYYKLPFRHNTPKGILTSPDMPHPFFGSNPMNPEPNWHNNWIRQDFSF